MSVFPGSVEASAVEDALAAHAATVLRVGSSDLGKAGRSLVAAIRDQHLARRRRPADDGPDRPEHGRTDVERDARAR